VQFYLPELARTLTEEFGRGFDASNLHKMKQFYLAFPILDALRPELSWTHYRTLLRLEAADYERLGSGLDRLWKLSFYSEKVAFLAVSDG
jgi:hypothetical protein